MKLRKYKGKYIVDGLHLSQVNEMLLDCGESLDVDVSLVDKRNMTSEQRKFIFALISNVGDELGYISRFDKEYLRAILMETNVRVHGVDKSSLKDYTVADANKLIETIIEFAFENDIGIDGEIFREYEYKFNERQMYMMALKRICCVCGKRADIHHVDQIGTKGNRKKISHVGLRAIPLCREHHTICHNNPKEFYRKYDITPFVIDAKMELFIKNKKLKEFD